MKLVRFGAPGREKPGIIDANGKIRDLSKIVPDIAGEALTPKGLAKIRKAKIDTLPLVRGNPRLGACVSKVGNFIAIGLNYADHAAEAGLKVPPEPVIFNKAPSCICGPNDDTMIPKDFEQARLGGGARHRHRQPRALSREEQGDGCGGRLLPCQRRIRARVPDRALGRQWTKGKSSETFGPLGPWLVTKDEIKDPQNLNMWLTVNGQTRQKGSTKTMVFGVEHLVWYCSQFFVMEPGDVIITGTPPGVGLGMKPTPQFLKAGDVVRLGIDGLGEQQQKIVKFKA